jgi:dienelactone hydrolase
VGNTCLFVVPPDLAEDVYRGLNLLAVRKDVDAKHVFVAGFGRAGSLVFAAIERDGIEHTARRKFKAAIAFYPPCGDVKGVMTVATLVVVGARDQGVLGRSGKGDFAAVSSIAARAAAVTPNTVSNVARGPACSRRTPHLVYQHAFSSHEPEAHFA